MMFIAVIVVISAVQAGNKVSKLVVERSVWVGGKQQIVATSAQQYQ